MLDGQNSKAQLLIAPIAKTSATTTTANFDTLGGAAATISIALKSEINTNAVGPTISILHCDTTVVSNFVTVVADRTAEDITNARLLKYAIDLRAKKRYLRVAITTATATNDDITVAVTGELHRLQEGPGSTTEMVATTNDVAVIVG